MPSHPGYPTSDRCTLVPLPKVQYTLDTMLTIHIKYFHSIYRRARGLCCATRRLPVSLSRCFWCFPLPVLGKSSPTAASPIQKTCCGALCLPRVLSTHSWISLSSTLWHPGVAFKKQPTTSPYLSSLMPTTLDSLIEECATSRSSISRGNMFSPPVSTIVSSVLCLLSGVGCYPG